METSSPQLRTLLLELLSTCRPVAPAAVAALDERDWETLLAMARQHRLLPLLHWRLSRERAELPVPQAVSETLAVAFKRSAMRALQMQQELVLLHRLLANAGVPHLALKGAYLALHAYPHPALRPMRDLDILVPQAQALDTYQLLLDNGFARSEHCSGDVEANLLARKHLPPLLSPSGRVAVELHTRLSGWQGSGRADIIEDGALWQRAIRRTIGDSELTFMSPTDLLLHLIDHAVYEHRFDNGPLTLGDLAYLLDGHVIDWPLFWRQAEQAGRSRGALLLLRMVEYYFGTQSIPWPDGEERATASVEQVMDTAALLTLRNFAARRDALLQRDLVGRATLPGKIGVFVQKAVPPKRKIATLYPVSERSPRVYLWYVAHWWRLMSVRMPQYLRSRAQGDTGIEAHRIAHLEQWLDEPP